MSTPVICAVNGVCVSGGLEIVLSAAFAVASDQARFADTHAKLGVVATWGLTAMLPRAVGISMAKELSITGRFVEADEALRLGLVNHVVPHDELLPFVRKLAESVVDTPAVTEVLRLYNRGAGLSLADALALETEHVTRRTFDPASARQRFDAR
jgi:enoyl-CoA hydratase